MKKLFLRRYTTDAQRLVSNDRKINPKDMLRNSSQKSCLAFSYVHKRKNIINKDIFGILYRKKTGAVTTPFNKETTRLIICHAYILGVIRNREKKILKIIIRILYIRPSTRK